jgi:hypothetical protein
LLDIVRLDLVVVELGEELPDRRHNRLLDPVIEAARRF